MQMYPFALLQMVFLLVPVAAMGFFGWLALRFVRARERDAATRVEGARPEELARVNDAILALQSEITSLRDRQDFIERLLEQPKPNRAP
jgi:hypothetical protein